MYGQDARVFAKEVPGAELIFQPEDLHLYAADDCDIRVTIADMPLDEGFCINVEDPRAVDQSIESLLDQYVLNPDRRDELDVADNPDLPYMQEELIQIFSGWRDGSLTLEFYINKNPEPGPIAPAERANKYLSTCMYEDDSFDYRLLDLVIVPSVPEPSAYEMANMKRENPDIFLLSLFDFHLARGLEAFQRFCREETIAQFLGASVSSSSTELYSELNNLYRKGLVKRDLAKKPDAVTGARYSTGLTGQAKEKLKQWQRELADVRKYDCYASVSVTPPALGVPEGFDVRVQMLEYDGHESLRSVLLCALDENKDEFFDPDHWMDDYETGEFLKIVNGAMAYKTNFLPDVLDELKKLADENTDN